ncbi:thiamine-phosphate kinase [Helicobacter cetorum]|uniref:thiamine-phosphate kinase n=1 Tax=Helicobacter cetorum TaxID=138563 RepID=UPI000CF1BA15|nr:thiamine-phosphate kinase [Helicobacter cetorum]
MDLEAHFFKWLKKTPIAQGIGDDGVVLSASLKGHFGVVPTSLKDKVLALDLFSEGVHFKREWFSLKALVQKAFLVNISDILCMNAIPKYALLGLSVPKDFGIKEWKLLQEGIEEVCLKWNIKLIGGDTITSNTLSFAITMIGETRGRALYRKGAKKGDLIVSSGRVGSSYKALHSLLRGGSACKKSRFFQLGFNVDFFKNLTRFIRIGLDISDGIYTECNRLSKLNKLDFRLFKKDERYKSGEEYEWLFCCSPIHKVHLKRLAKRYRAKIEILGHVKRGRSSYKEKKWH